MTKFSNMGARFSAQSPRESPFQPPKSAPNYVTLPTIRRERADAIQPVPEIGQSDIAYRQKRCALLFHMTGIFVRSRFVSRWRISREENGAEPSRAILSCLPG